MGSMDTAPISEAYSDFLHVSVQYVDVWVQGKINAHQHVRDATEILADLRLGKVLSQRNRYLKENAYILYNAVI